MSYCLFILSLWQEADSTPPSRPEWRYALEDPQTGERTGFSDMKGLVQFLQDPARQHNQEDSMTVAEQSRAEMVQPEAGESIRNDAFTPPVG